MGPKLDFISYSDFRGQPGEGVFLLFSGVDKYNKRKISNRPITRLLPSKPDSKTIKSLYKDYDDKKILIDIPRGEGGGIQAVIDAYNLKIEKIRKENEEKEKNEVYMTREETSKFLEEGREKIDDPVAFDAFLADHKKSWYERSKKSQNPT